jgi:hypothetical protein
MYLKERDYRFAQPTTTEDNAKDAQEMAKVLTKDGYRDVVKWINSATSPESIITRIKEDGACTNAIKTETTLLLATLDETSSKNGG